MRRNVIAPAERLKRSRVRRRITRSAVAVHHIEMQKRGKVTSLPATAPPDWERVWIDADDPCAKLMLAAQERKILADVPVAIRRQATRWSESSLCWTKPACKTRSTNRSMPPPQRFPSKRSSQSRTAVSIRSSAVSSDTFVDTVSNRTRGFRQLRHRPRQSPFWKEATAAPRPTVMTPLSSTRLVPGTTA